MQKFINTVLKSQHNSEKVVSTHISLYVLFGNPFAGAWDKLFAPLCSPSGVPVFGVWLYFDHVPSTRGRIRCLDN